MEIPDRSNIHASHCNVGSNILVKRTLLIVLAMLTTLVMLLIMSVEL